MYGFWVDLAYTDAVNYYRVLGVEPHAELKEIKRAYRRLAKEYHPDVNRHDPNAEGLFQRIAEAYSVLSDEDERAHYDSQLRAQSVSHVPYNPFQHANSSTRSAHTTQGYASYHCSDYQSSRQHSSHWDDYLRGFEQQMYPKYSLQNIPLFHRFVLGALLLGMAVAMLSMRSVTVIPLMIAKVLFAVVSSWWLHRMETSFMTRHKAAGLVEIMLVYLMSAVIAAVVSIPLSAFFILSAV